MDIREVVEGLLKEARIYAKKNETNGMLPGDFQAGIKYAVSKIVSALDTPALATAPVRTVPRKEVQWFAEQMERKLRANDHKSPWSECQFGYLIKRLRDELAELEDCFDGEHAKDSESVIMEAADIANFAMMIADKHRAAIAGKGE